VSFGAGGSAAPPAAAPTGPRARPGRIEAAAAPPPAAGAEAKAAEAKPAAADKPRVTVEGPEAAKVGDEISVAVRLASSSSLGRIRTQVGFDASALQLVSAEPGDLTPSGESPKVDTKPGGVQVELAGGDDAPITGSGTLVELRFKVVLAKPVSIVTQVVLVGQEGVAVAATQATPLKIAVSQ
jgi:hypothetical protein